MSDYTPNWAEIKIHFVRSATDSTNSIAVMNEHEEMADRWLAQHEAKIVKQTEERIIALLIPDQTDCGCPKYSNYELGTYSECESCRKTWWEQIAAIKGEIK